MIMTASEAEKKEAMRKFSKLLFATGVAFLSIGMYNWLSPQFAAGFLNLPLSSVRMIAGGVAFIGLSDIFVAKFVLLKRETL